MSRWRSTSSRTASPTTPSCTPSGWRPWPTPTGPTCGWWRSWPEKFKDEPDKTLRRKLARQAARSVLPNATETKIFVSANARALRHFIEMRASRHAEVEIRKLAVKVLEIMQAEAPNLFGDYRLEPLPDGTREAVTPHRKV